VKLLITSGRGLVGKNILDGLEYPRLSRRKLAQIAGTSGGRTAAHARYGL